MEASGSRLQDLPTELLHRVLRTAGRPTRRVCRLFRTAYGPLDAGLCLEHFSTGHQLQQLLATSSSPHAFRHIRTLVLHPSPRTTSPPASLLSPLPVVFPTLRALHLGPSVTLKPALLRALAPLAPHLTALSAITRPALAAPLAATFTALRSLTLACWPARPDHTLFAQFRSDYPHLLTSLHPLAPTLLHLDLDTSDSGHHSPHSTLPHLAPFTARTHLALSVSDEDEAWTPETPSLLASGMPHLQSLDCRWGFRDDRPADPLFAGDYHPPPPDDILAALATRTALTSLSLTLSGIPYARLHPLRLSHLCIETWTATPDLHYLVELLQTVGQSQTLTSLEFSGRASLSSLTQACPLLSPTLRTLTWHTPCPPATLLPLRQLTLLESLHLALFCPEPLGDSQAAIIANALARLTCLRLDVTPSADCNHQYPLAALVRQVACRGALRHLALDCWEPCWGEALLAPLATSLVRLSVMMLHLDVWEGVSRLGHLRALRCLCIEVRCWGSHRWVPLQGQAAVSRSWAPLAWQVAGGSAADGPGSEPGTSQGATGASSSSSEAAAASASSSKALAGGSAAGSLAAHEAAGGTATAEHGQQARGSSKAGGLGAPRQSSRLLEKRQQQKQAAGGSEGGSAQQAGRGGAPGQQAPSGRQQAAGRGAKGTTQQAGRGGAGLPGPGATQQQQQPQLPPPPQEQQPQQEAAGRSEGRSLQVRLPPGLRQLCLDVSDGGPQDEASFPVEPVWGAVLAAAARQDCVVRVATERPMPSLSTLRLAAFDDCHGYRDGAADGFTAAGGCL